MDKIKQLIEEACAKYETKKLVEKAAEEVGLEVFQANITNDKLSVALRFKEKPLDVIIQLEL